MAISGVLITLFTEVLEHPLAHHRDRVEPHHHVLCPLHVLVPSLLKSICQLLGSISVKSEPEGDPASLLWPWVAPLLWPWVASLLWPRAEPCWYLLLLWYGVDAWLCHALLELCSVPGRGCAGYGPIPPYCHTHTHEEEGGC